MPAAAYHAVFNPDMLQPFTWLSSDVCVHAMYLALGRQFGDVNHGSIPQSIIDLSEPPPVTEPPSPSSFHYQDTNETPPRLTLLSIASFHHIPYAQSDLAACNATPFPNPREEARGKEYERRQC